MPPSLLTDVPSAGVVRIEVTVTELNASSPAVNLLTTALLFVPFDAGGVAFDARFYDGESREPFARTTYRHISTPLELKGSFRRYGHATQALRDWAEGYSERTCGDGLAKNREPKLIAPAPFSKRERPGLFECRQTRRKPDGFPTTIHARISKLVAKSRTPTTSLVTEIKWQPLE